MSKRSKGPWRLRKGSTRVHADGIAISQSGYVGGQSAAHMQAARETRLANAKAISLVPRMADALGRLRDLYLKIDDENDICIATVMLNSTKYLSAKERAAHKWFSLWDEIVELTNALEE